MTAGELGRPIPTLHNSSGNSVLAKGQFYREWYRTTLMWAKRQDPILELTYYIDRPFEHIYLLKKKNKFAYISIIFENMLFTLSQFIWHHSQKKKLP